MSQFAKVVHGAAMIVTRFIMDHHTGMNRPLRSLDRDSENGALFRKKTTSKFLPEMDQMYVESIV